MDSFFYSQQEGRLDKAGPRRKVARRPQACKEQPVGSACGNSHLPGLSFSFFLISRIENTHLDLPGSFLTCFCYPVLSSRGHVRCRFCFSRCVPLGETWARTPFSMTSPIKLHLNGALWNAGWGLPASWAPSSRACSTQHLCVSRTRTLPCPILSLGVCR